MQSGYALCAFLLHHILAVAGTLRLPLSQPQKRHIQPERYAKIKKKIKRIFVPNIIFRFIPLSCLMAQTFFSLLEG
jgi:hypothetical protein